MVVGITGEIGAGKTTLAKIFESWGAEFISGDEIGWELLQPGQYTYKLLLQEYGRDIIDTDGRVDRRKLGKIVFSSPEETRQFNDLIHPELLKRLRERIEKARTRSAVVVVDAALIVEWHIMSELDTLIVVIADERRRIERLKRATQLSDEELRDRFKSQLPRAEKLKYADWIVENNGDLTKLHREAERIWRALNMQRETHS
ncbi:hypothetical protein AMJ40_01275 [candidate division TA06 bacterium DG_26]|uniref:Dephospho-CoA kinase n=1 Tax=candidate division TA06 bacterium DG_26 TaxID=1703771 RepID=A0A0S7WLF6_UNCT6|nr:MAG: hypothetical protein AMJ40_01275 [candidate division TA06 bacterium DG_26]